MAKFWSLLFGVTMAACLGLFVAAPFVEGWWLPEGVSSHFRDIDQLFYIILIITGFFFILTEAILCCFLFRYASQPDGKPPVLGPSVMAKLIKPVTGILNEPHKIELAWTIVPAGILLWIAFAQVGTWANVKYQSRYPDFVGDKVPVVTEISARQFEWRIRYPSHKRTKQFLSRTNKEMAETANRLVKTDFDTFGKHAQFDDLHTVNELHVIKNHPTLVHLGTRDVIHSFNMPHLRIKQDALPGKVIPVWFIATKANTIKQKAKGSDAYVWEDNYNHVAKEFDPKTKHRYEIACAELCGWGHYRMIGRLYVHDTREDFLDWLEHHEKAERATTR